MTITISDEVLRKEFTSAFLRVWDTSVGYKLNSEDPSKQLDMSTRWIAGVVWMGGSWTGSIALAMPTRLGLRITSAQLNERLETIKHEQIEDAVKELTNMIAGNLKSALPGQTGLATPGFFELNKRSNLANEFTRVISLCYGCEGESLIVELHGLLE